MTTKRPATSEANASLEANRVFTAGLTKSFPKAANYAGAIRRKCLDCCGGSPGEVDACAIKSCALWPFRMGSSPFKARRQRAGEVA